ncbi:MAG: IreB family regulatory phosphoprotein [Defluviitaleaceae bacterium]|nr:IreB family regulatory phosphoprotein [Defluviitaleaceae bacterium]
MRPKNVCETQKISFINRDAQKRTREVLIDVREALIEKGYDPYVQIVGYILSGDPTYITAHNNARAAIGRLERDELLEEMLVFFMENKK